MTMSALRLQSFALLLLTMSRWASVRRLRGVSKNEGGLPGSWTQGTPMPIPSASDPSTGGGRLWTGVSALALVRVDQEFLAGRALVVDRDVPEIERFGQRDRLGVV